MTDFDICIIGAGPAGSASAYLLARAGFRVALFDRARFPRDKTCGDGITPRGARILQKLGVLDAVQAKAFACVGVKVRSSDAVTYSIEFTKDVNGPSDLLVLPRFEFDEMLLSHALSAGPVFFPDTKITGVRETARHGASGCEVATRAGSTYSCRLAVLATGAESQLLRATGLLEKKPPPAHAARAYFDNVAGLTDEIVLFFDEIDQPGYGWIFPTSPTSANIGCGVFKGGAIPQTERLRQLITRHPLLKRMLADATQRAPIAAYPLRTDFKPEYAGDGRFICVGEAAGLVNPLTGEGIDYALETAEFLRDAVLRHWSPGAVSTAGDRTSRIVDCYRTRLAKRFYKRFLLYRFVQRHALTESRSKRLLEKMRETPAMQRIAVDALFGRARPSHLFKPTVLFHVARMMLAG